ncbi:hypothetical protein E4K72_08080 [Oxalobacteraceae bacterium OM1]|nr:hypothetical protein E4K72_08080 [Oxalobacteraceae bacterium OM1]
MKSIVSLPFKGLPYTDEGFMGYLLRMSNMHHLRGLRWLYKTLERESILRVLPEDVPTVAAIFQVPDSILAQHFIACYADEGKLCYRVRNQTLRRLYLLRHMRPQLCPLCIRENGFSHFLWDFSFVTACTQHSCTLIDSCPRCLKRIRWSRPLLSACSCGHAWADTAVQSIGEGSFEYSVAGLVATQTGVDGGSSSITWCPVTTMLSQVSLSTLFELIWAFGIKDIEGDAASFSKAKAIPRTPLAVKISKLAHQRLGRLLQKECTDISVAAEVHLPALLSLAKESLDATDAYWVSFLFHRLGRSSSLSRHRKYHIPQQLQLF